MAQLTSRAHPAGSGLSPVDKRQNFRPEIQALRALAVALVVAYHYWPAIVRGGYVGVDVFFVISGFLITGHIVRSSGQPLGTAVLDFWARRVRRLLPASLLVLLVTAVGVFVFVPRGFWQQFFSEIGASALYVQNWLLASNSVNYLAATNPPSPVQHYWSLSVEEQFYVVWPILILGATLILARARVVRWRGALVALLAFIAVASLVYGVYLTATHPTVAYFATTSRVWEFGAGGILALLVPNSPTGMRRVRVGASWLGLALILGSALFYTAVTPFPGIAAVVPVVGCLAVLWSGMPESSVSPVRLFRLRPVQYLGDISYSLYLWHFTLLVLGGYAVVVVNGLVFKITVLLIALVLSAITKTFVEDPARRARFLASHRPRRTFIIMAVSMLVIVAVAALGWVNQQQFVAAANARAQTLVQKNPACFGAEALAPGSHCPITQIPYSEIVPAVDAASDETDKCLLDDTESGVHNDCEYKVTGATTTWALIGDSHAGSLAPAIALVAKAHHANLELFDHGHCPLVHVASPGKARDPGLAVACADWNANILKYLTSHSQITRIVVTGSSVMHTYLPASDREGSERQTRELVSGYAAAWRDVPQSVRSIVVVRDVPRQLKDSIPCIDERTSNYLAPCSTSRRVALPADAMEIAAKADTSKRISLIDVSDYLCTPSTCPIVIGGVLVDSDNQHLTPTFAETLAPYIAQQLK